MKEVIIIAIVLGIALALWLIVGFFVVRYIRRDKSVQYTIGGVPIPWGNKTPEEKQLDDASPQSPPGMEVDPESQSVREPGQHTSNDIEIRPIHQHQPETPSQSNRPTGAQTVVTSCCDSLSPLHPTWSASPAASLQTSEGSPQITAPICAPQSPTTRPLVPSRPHTANPPSGPSILLPPPPRYEDAIV